MTSTSHKICHHSLIMRNPYYLECAYRVTGRSIGFWFHKRPCISHTIRLRESCNAQGFYIISRLKDDSEVNATKQNHGYAYLYG